MNDPTSLHDDLQFVRSAVERSQRAKSPSSIWYLWAAISLVGFALIDFRPQVVGVYWLIAAPVGFALSIWLARRSHVRSGQTDRAVGRRWIEHWAGLLGAVLLLMLAGATGQMDGRAIGGTAVLLTAFAYFTAGVHLEPRLKRIGILIALAYPILLYVVRWGWTGTGVIVAIALVLTAVSVARESRHAG
jgi:hypothetical protein